jgi:NADH-quinone oxidoreductase subunit E
MLLESQEEFGYLNAACIEEISRLLEIPEIDIREVISFYSMLRTSPVGKYHIQVCTNISCMLLHSETMLEHLSRKLGIRPGETTPDRRFSLAEVECLGACCNAPAMQVNQVYYENLTLERVDQILEELKGRA